MSLLQFLESDGINRQSVSEADPLPVTGGAGIGAAADASASSDTGTFSLISLFKRLLEKATLMVSALQDTTTPVPVVPGGRENETVAASQTDQILGATGAVGDVLDFILIVPASTSPGAVDIQDGDGTAVNVFAGGASSVTTLIPFPVPWGKACVNATTPGWKITTGANVSVVGFGNFT